MSTGAIIAIVVGAVIVLAIIALLVSRMGTRRRQRQLEARRSELANQHREVAADQAARARAAESEAKRAQAEAQLHEARADMHERGLADEELEGGVDGVGEKNGAVGDGDGRATTGAAEERPVRRA